MFYVDDTRREYLARQIGDLGKNILTAAIATYFFKDFALFLRFGMCIMGCVFLYIGFLIQPSKKGVQKWP